MTWERVRQRTSWYNMRLSVDYVADHLGVKSQSIRQYVSVGGAEGFPPPDLKVDRKNYWRPATLYDFIDASRPHLRTQIPRLYPLISSSHDAPATFLGTEGFEVGKGTWWSQGVVHFWQPADDRGRVIVAYPDQPWSIDVACDLAALIAGQHPGISAVVVVTDSESRTPDPEHPERDDPRRHRGIGVWDKNLARPGDDPDGRWRYYFSWSDLAYLLRTDVPYWPTGLLDTDAMAAWRPGEVRRITPRYRTHYQIRQFSAALVEACKDDSALLRILGRACRIINYATAQDLRLIPPPAITMASETGLLVAATPDVDPVAPEALTVDERARLLHIAANPRYAEEALLIGSLGDGFYGYWGLWNPILGRVTTIDRVGMGPLAQRWYERLRPLTATRRPDELGFTWIYSAIANSPEGDGPHQCLHDPLQPDCWIVETSTRIYVTTGSQLRRATGQLQAIEIGVTPGQFTASYPAFVEDGSSTPWIMPTPRSKPEPYRLGYDGSGARGMAIAIRELCTDLNALLSGNDDFAFIDDVEEPCALRDIFIGLNAPLTLHRNDIDRLLNLVP
ncbi:hypothetical protein ACX9NJ_23520 [Mycobacterium sp. ML2]